ncbi:hypothetical protein U1Q18_014551 [Sarracenia purpurea var. burkii]
MEKKFTTQMKLFLTDALSLIIEDEPQSTIAMDLDLVKSQKEGKVEDLKSGSLRLEMGLGRAVREDIDIEVPAQVPSQLIEVIQDVASAGNDPTALISNEQDQRPLGEVMPYASVGTEGSPSPKKFESPKMKPPDKPTKKKGIEVGYLLPQLDMKIGVEEVKDKVDEGEFFDVGAKGFSPKAATEVLRVDLIGNRLGKGVREQTKIQYWI